MFRLAVFALSVVFCSPALSAWSDVLPIQNLKAASNGKVFVRLEGFVNNDSAISCVNDYFVMHQSDDGYDSRLSFLLSAYMAGKPVRLSYYGCNGDAISLSSVVLPE